MKRKFGGMKARDYEFKNHDGTTERHVIVLYAGDKRVGFIEYDTAYALVNKVHDLTEAHEARTQRSES